MAISHQSRYLGYNDINLFEKRTSVKIGPWLENDNLGKYFPTSFHSSTEFAPIVGQPNV